MILHCIRRFFQLCSRKILVITVKPANNRTNLRIFTATANKMRLVGFLTISKLVAYLGGTQLEMKTRLCQTQYIIILF